MISDRARWRVEGQGVEEEEEDGGRSSGLRLVEGQERRESCLDRAWKAGGG